MTTVMKTTMKWSLAFAVFATVAGATIVAAGIFGPPDLPPGVTREQWKPLSDDVGLVVARLGGAPMGDKAAGFFMVRIDGRWTRVSVGDLAVPDVMPAK